MSQSVAVSTGYRPGEREYRRLSVALFAAGLATFALLYSTQPLLPELVDDFQVSPGQSAFSVSFATFGLGLALLVAGPWSERIGRTTLMRWSVAATSFFALLTAFAPTWHTLLALRGLQGIAMAGLPAVAMAYLREEVHASSHARASGLYIAGTAVGGMSGRLVAGGLADIGGWRFGAAGIAIVGVLCAAVVWWLLPASRNFRPGSAHPKELRVLRDPALLALYGIAATAVGGFVAVYNGAVFRLSGEPYHLSAGAAGLVFCVYLLGSVGSATAGTLADRHGRRAVVPVGCLITLAGVAITLAAPLPMIVAGLAVMTAGFFAVHGVASGWVPARAHAAGVSTGQASSMYLFAFYLGSSAFGGLAGTAWSHGGWPGVALEAGVLFAVALVLTLLLRAVPRLDR
ncbi:MFS transporter [Kribbella sandramycini]|uniref:MFS transporter n=1 Tax=Kribbella sandramycini TaxID=60450 RepID=A0A7Y4L637_9ACTN|nr:MFS transporter [Kribbella sandramycini]MBB6566068.1 YNFM family putative membrane transporter [Kribbella sandramycini]NOL45069.1 MFS transporter [Kribbella sandramycini]